MSNEYRGDRSRDEVIAGEYVLGVLPNGERPKIEQRIREDSTFASIVSRWETNLARFSDHDASAIETPAQLFNPLETQIFPEAIFVQRPSLWNSVVFWRSLALATVFLTASWGAYYSATMNRAKPQGRRVAQLSNDDNDLTMIVNYEPKSGLLKLSPVAAGGPPHRSLELWVIEGGNAPVSIGVLPYEGNSEITVPSEMRLRIKDGVILEMTVEPFGGSPFGTPTGQVVMAGKAVFN